MQLDWTSLLSVVSDFGQIDGSSGEKGEGTMLTYGLHPAVFFALDARQPHPGTPQQVEQPEGDVGKHQHEDMPHRQAPEELAAVLASQSHRQHSLHVTV